MLSEKQLVAPHNVRYWKTEDEPFTHATQYQIAAAQGGYRWLNLNTTSPHKQIVLASAQNRPDEYKVCRFQFTLNDSGWLATRYYGQDNGKIHIPAKKDLFLRVAKFQFACVAKHFRLSSDIVHAIALFVQETDFVDERLDVDSSEDSSKDSSEDSSDEA